MENENLQETAENPPAKAGRKAGKSSKDFDHRVNIDLLKMDTGLTLEDIAKVAEITDPRNLYKWSYPKSKGGMRPTYDTIAKLIERGATTQSLLGVEYKAGVKVVEKPVTQGDVDTAVLRALARLGEGVKPR